MHGKSPSQQQPQTHLFKPVLSLHEESISSGNSFVMLATSDLVHFRKRIGEDGALKLFQLSIDLRQSKVEKATEVLYKGRREEYHLTN